jgi:hypothetical protein
VCRDCATADGQASCREPVTKPVGKPDAGNPHVRFDERGGETGHASDTAPFLDSTVASKAEFKSRILAYLDDLNAEPVVVHTWTYKIGEAA